MKISNNFKIAKIDYKYMLERGYSQKSILKIIGDRYMLTGYERTMLYRGVTTDEKANYRLNKKANPDEIKNNDLYIDGYNVLITISSYLKGSLVFIGNDGFLRDASEIHEKKLRKDYFDKSILLLLDYLKNLEIKNVYFLFDTPVNNSGRLCQEINNLLIKKNIKGDARTTKSPDFILKNINKGYCATSDSTIIDVSKTKIFDLSFFTIKYFYNPIFFNINELHNNYNL